MGVRPHGPIDVEPGVHHAHLDQAIDPFLRHQVVDVGLADAGADAGKEPVVEAILQAFHGLAEHPAPAAALVADDLVALHADQRRHVAQPAHLASAGVGDKLAVGEDLEIAVGMLGQHVEKVGMHERLAADNAKEDIAHLLRFAQQLVHGLGLDNLLLGGHVHPAALAAQIAAINNRDVQEGRKDLAFFQALLVLFHREHALDAHVPEQLPQQPFIRFQQQTTGQLQKHGTPR